MATEHAQKHQYEYKNNANLVLQADRSLIDNRPKDEPRGEVQSLIPHLSKYKMGDKYQREKPKNKKPKKTETEMKLTTGLDEISQINYKPRTMETRASYESLLCFIQNTIGEHPRDILMGAADEVLAALKDEQKTDKIKRNEINSLLGFLNDDDYTILLNLTKKITDYYGEYTAHDESVAVTVQYENSESDTSYEESEKSEEEFNKTITTAHEINEESNQLDPYNIDAFWLQRELNKFYNDPDLSLKKSKECMSLILEDDRELENKLIINLGCDKFKLIKLICQNRTAVLYGHLLSCAESQEEKDKIENDMRNLFTKNKSNVVVTNTENKNTEIYNVYDLNMLSFKEGSHLMLLKKCHLPEGSYRKSFKGYEEVFVPAHTPVPLEDNEKLIPITSIDSKYHAIFSGYQFFNRIQSAIFDKAYNSSENLLICAPTGSGKTNIAILSILHELTKNPNYSEIKVIYVAPMKSLVQEMVQNFSKRFGDLNLTVSEMTGDHQLNREQIENSHILVCTPEKWDIVTRKSENIYTELVKLVIFDEIHLLHDSRGPVIESLVARIRGSGIRLIGLSATLPNYQSIATFLNVNIESGLFYFDASYRPVPLEQHFIGITEKKPLKSIKIMNDIVYEKILESHSQVLVFVHSRKETLKTAKYIRDLCLEKETLIFVKNDTASAEILKSEADSSKNPELKELLPFGLGIHHAGMNKTDRKLVEDLFSDGHIQVLFSTATLAWGVNLPARRVIIKGTQIYEPQKGKWVELSAIDVLQMLGRAGRPQYDSKGTGILITSHNELQYYLSLTNQQLPIESQLISKLAECLNAEIALKNITTITQGSDWLTLTYLYVRMLSNPLLYGIPEEEIQSDETLLDRRLSLIHSAALGLDKSGLIKYDVNSGVLEPTELGMIASHFYCTHETMSTFNRLLRGSMTQIELFRTIAMSSEFKYINVRAEEKLELQQLLEKVPIPVKETIEESSAKINVLLQAYISGLKLEGFVLMADMVYVTQSANRLVRAVFEICLHRKWAEMTEKALNLSKMIDNRMWSSMSPLRQFKMIPPEIIRKIEKKDFQWERFYDLEPHEIGEIIHAPKMGKVLHKFIHHFPKLELSAHAQPITRSLLRIELTIIPDFKWDSIHGNAQAFWVFITDADNEKILHSEYFILNHRYCEDEHYLKCYVPLFDPLPPNYYVKVLSDKWIRSETVLPISLLHLILPEKTIPPTELLDLQLLHNEFNKIFKFSHFNSIQTQVFESLYKSVDSIFIGAPAGSGKSALIELSILNFLNNYSNSKCVIIIPLQIATEFQFKRLKILFHDFDVSFGMLTGESTADIKIMNSSTIILSSTENFDMFSRRWKQRKVIQAIKMVIIDDIHMIGAIGGPVLEIVCSRIRYISSQLDKPIRIVALSASLVNSRDLGQWLGISSNNIFNFHPSSRPLPLTINITTYNLNNPITRLKAMQKTLISSIKLIQNDIIVFVETRKMAKLLSLEIAALSEPIDSDIAQYIQYLREKEIKITILNGVGYLHEGMSSIEIDTVSALFNAGLIKIILVSRSMIWNIDINASVVFIMDTQYYDGRFHSYTDYPVTDLLKMIGRVGRYSDRKAQVEVFCLASKKDQILRFLKDPLPIESHLDHYLHDHFCAEVVTKVIENKQDAVDYLTWTFLYRRLTQNPNYYNMQGVTHRHLSDHLSELVETTINDLATSKCITIEDEMSVFPLNSAMIASYYYINYSTIELFNASLTPKTKLNALIEIISNSQEFENINVRLNEEVFLKSLVEKVPYKPKDGKFTDSHNKANLLIQAYLSRISLPSELQKDADFVIRKCHKLAQACVDVLSSNGWLTPAIIAMEFAQMITQAVWSRDSPLKQIPFFSNEIVERCKEKKIETVFDILDMDDEPRRSLLNLPETQLVKVAEFCNKYPSIDVKYSVTNEGYVSAGDPLQINVEVEREEESSHVIAPFFPYPREEAIWVVIGDSKKSSLLTIKRVNLQKAMTLKLDLVAPEEVGQHSLSLYVISDSYLGSDQEFQIELHVNPSVNIRKRKASEEASDDEEKIKK